ncbi:MAG: SDR family NAD(P)-dependent oxidoreductase [Caulobacterales bacterium]|nr:SDR family NAD(P)-dependent oxidoreductase [Caulobacterales bacterium]
MNVDGVVAVMTGGASGIGFGVAQALAKRGAKVVLADIEAERALAAAETLRDQGLEATSCYLDVIDQASWDATADLAFGHWDQAPQLLFNNAGVAGPGTVHGVSRQTWAWVFKVNVEGVYLGVKTFAPRMLDSGLPCRIVNTASEHALGLPDSAKGGISAAYTSAKHAVMGYSLCARRDFAGTNLSVGVVCPGPVATDIWNSFRNRHGDFGGPRLLVVEGEVPMSRSLPFATAGERIVEQVEDDAFFIFTNGPNEAEVIETYQAEVTAAMAAFRQRYGV